MTRDEEGGTRHPNVVFRHDYDGFRCMVAAPSEGDGARSWEVFIEEGSERRLQGQSPFSTHYDDLRGRPSWYADFDDDVTFVIVTDQGEFRVQAGDDAHTIAEVASAEIRVASPAAARPPESTLLEDALTGFTQPTPLARVKQGAPATPGVYVVSAGDCVAHIGTSGKVQSRLRTLAALGNHRGSAEVLCAAFCSGSAPVVRWQATATAADARATEKALKAMGEPPQPRSEYEQCRNGEALRRALVEAAGGDSFEAGYVTALFEVGEQLHRLFAPRFMPVWAKVGLPPGPWPATASA